MFRGGTVLTGDPRRPQTDALAIAEGRLVALGDDAAALDGDVIEITGQTVVPGFRDGHIHPLWGGTESLDAPVVDAADLEDLLERVGTHAAQNPDEPWVVGHGYPCEMLPGAVGRAEWLDRVVADRPVALWASDHHTMWVNSAALRAAGIDAATPDPPAGEIVKDADGQPVGTLREGAMDAVASLVPARDTVDKGKGLRIALAQMAAAGIVWAQEAALSPDDVDVYLDVMRSGSLTADVDIALRVDPARWREQRDAFVAARRGAELAVAECDADRVGGGRVTVRTVKVFADGVIESGTGALLEPYTDAPHSHGIPNWEAAELAEALTAFDADGFQAHIHAIGDAAIRMSLDGIEQVLRRNGPRERRPVIAHTQLVHPDDVARFAALGTVANFEPLWACQSLVMTQLTEPRLGEERSRWQYPIASVLATGAPVSFGSDWPVSSMVPMEGIAVAVTRQTPEGEPPGGWLPDERLTLDQALRAYTAGTAYQAFDAAAGTLAEGARADVCVLDADLASLPAAELSGVAVAGTWLHGVEVHRL